MPTGQYRFPISVRTGWIDYSPAIRYHALQRARSRMAAFAPQIRSVAIRISQDELHTGAQRRCDIEVITADAGPISASLVGVDLFRLVDGSVATIVAMLRARTAVRPQDELSQRIA